MNLKRIGLDTSKAVFTLHGVDQYEKPVLRRNIRRAGLEAFFTKLPPTVVALEACGGSHHWGRRLAALGHTVRLVRRGKNDRNDAEAICEEASRPSMPSVPVKAAEQQAAAITGVGGQVVDTMRHRPSEFLDQKIMHAADAIPDRRF